MSSSFIGFPPSPLTFALVEPEAQTHFSFSIFFMNNDIISKNCWRGKGLRAPSGFDNTHLPHVSLSLWTRFGCCNMIFGEAVVLFGVEVIRVWCCRFFFPLLNKTLLERHREMRKMMIPQLSIPLCLSVLHLLSPQSLSPTLCLFLFLFLFLVPLSGRLSSPPSICFISLFPLFFPLLSLPLFLILSPSPQFCWGRVEVISRCITLAMCRQWMGLWQRLDSLGPWWQRRAGEENNYTYTWEDLPLFTKWKKRDSGYFIYCFIFFPPRTGGRVGECEPVVCGLAEHAGFQYSV